MFSNGNTASVTKINTGITPNANNVYRVAVFLPSSGTASYVTLESFSKTGVTVFTASNTANVPVSGTLMYFNMMTNSALTGVAATMALISAVEELY